MAIAFTSPWTPGWRSYASCPRWGQSVGNVDLVTNLMVEPKIAVQLHARISAQAERMMKATVLPVLLSYIEKLATR